jgi:putative ABC transport system permease protein
MKFLPLLWSAICRNRTESLLTLLGLTVAFTLFGSMVALNAAYGRVLGAVRMDRLYVLCAFRCPGLPIGPSAQLARVPGVTGVGYLDWLNGYHQERSRRIGIYMVDAGMRRGWSELSLSPAEWDLLEATPTGLFFSRKAAALWHVRKEDTFPVIVEPSIRADGATAWMFTVLGVFDDAPESQTGQAPDLVLGNYQYFNESRPLSAQSKGVFFRLAVDREDHAHGICRQIEARFANSAMPVYCVPVRDDATQLTSGNVSLRYMSLAVAAAGLFMILFLCASGIAESVRERLPELGILKTIGFDNRHISQLLFFEAMIPAVAGALIGTALARIVDSVISRLSAEIVRGMPRPVVSMSVLGWAVASALLVAAISAAVPLRRIRHMDVAAVLAGK